MLPNVKLTRLRTAAVAAVTSISLVAATAAPVQAAPNDAEKLLGGIAAAVIVGTIANEAMKPRTQDRVYDDRYVYYPEEQPRYRPRYDDDRYYGDRRYDERRHDRRYDDRRYDDRRYEERDYGYQGGYQGGYGNGVAQGFAEYSPASKRAIQSRLRAYGYYRGSIDGAFGPGTRNAIEAYARDTGNTRLLGSRNGTVTLLNGLLG